MRAWIRRISAPAFVMAWDGNGAESGCQPQSLAISRRSSPSSFSERSQASPVARHVAVPGNEVRPGGGAWP